MSFNAGPSEATLKKNIFSWKFNKPSHSSPALTETSVEQASSQKHPAITLIKKLTFDKIIEQVKFNFYFN